MIALQMDVQPAIDHVEAVRLRILAGIRDAMTEGMQMAAEAIAGRIHSRSGDLAEAVLRSPRVLETPSAIIGEVSAQTPKFRNKALWVEFGVAEPEVRKALYQFAPADGDSVYTHGHKAFRIAPHSFFNPAWEETYPTILELIQAKIEEACDG